MPQSTDDILLARTLFLTIFQIFNLALMILLILVVYRTWQQMVSHVPTNKSRIRQVRAGTRRSIVPPGRSQVVCATASKPGRPANQDVADHCVVKDSLILVLADGVTHSGDGFGAASVAVQEAMQQAGQWVSFWASLQTQRQQPVDGRMSLSNLVTPRDSQQYCPTAQEWHEAATALVNQVACHMQKTMKPLRPQVGQIPACTLVLVIVRPLSAGRYQLLWTAVGDSSAAVVPVGGDKAKWLLNEDRGVAERGDAMGGNITQALPVGYQTSDIESGVQDLASGDVVLLASDGFKKPALAGVNAQIFMEYVGASEDVDEWKRTLQDWANQAATLTHDDSTVIAWRAL